MPQVASPELCVHRVEPSDALIHCLVKRSGNATKAMIVHVRREHTARPAFELVPLARNETRGIVGSWLDPSSTSGKQAHFVASDGDRLQQPSSFSHDAMLTLSF